MSLLETVDCTVCLQCGGDNTVESYGYGFVRYCLDCRFVEAADGLLEKS